MSCYTNLLDLARASSCTGKLSLDMQAQAGEYTLEVEFLDSIQQVKQTFQAGDNLAFDLSTLNENYVFIGRVYAPDGSPVIKEINGVSFDVFSFETIFTYKTA